MDLITNHKRKATMVLLQIEESLGKYILRFDAGTGSLSENFLNQVIDRSQTKNEHVKPSMKNVLEETYLQEVFDIALNTTKNTSEYDVVLSLLELFRTYEMFNIRNSLTHPNRPFISAYWYRVASIASDPIIDRLRLNEVTEALYSAEKGNIISPSDEWLNKYNWQIKNNLPDFFEHHITGLLGRQEELQELKLSLVNKRNNTIAIVAPGGFGKTALALDLLNSLVSQPETNEWTDGIIFISMKNEKLTSNGIEKLDAIETLDQIKEAIKKEINLLFDEELDLYEDAISKYEDKKILLFVDNLETLLRDSEQIFSEFNGKLPLNWKVLVTSRVSITNSFLIPLKTLKKSSAIHLARTYINRTVGDNIEESIIENVAYDGISGHQRRNHSDSLKEIFSVTLF